MCEIRRWTAGALQCVEHIVLLCVRACVFSQFVCTSSPEEKTQINTSSWNRQRWSLVAVTAVGAHLVHQATSSIFFKELVCDARDGGCIRHTVSGPPHTPKKANRLLSLQPNRERRISESRGCGCRQTSNKHGRGGYRANAQGYQER